MTGTDRLSSHTNAPTVDYYLSADQLSQSVVNNTSVVRCYVRAVCRGNTSTFYNFHDAYVTFQVSGQGPYGATGNFADLAAGTANGSAFWEYGPYDVTIAHNADGTGSASLLFYVNYPNASSGGGLYSAPLALTTIPRATTPTTSAGTVEVGASVNVILAPAAPGFSHRVWWSFGGVSNKNAGLSGGGGSASGTDGTDGYWATGTGNRTVALAVPTNMARQMVGLSSQPLTVSVDTYDGGTKIGTTKTINVSVTPADGVVYNLPSVSGSVIRSLSNGTPAADGVCATLVVTAGVTSIDTGSEQNALTYLWEVFAGTWQTLATATPGGLTLTAQAYTYTDSNPGTGGTQTFATTSSYQFRLTVTDAIGGSATMRLTMSTAAAILDVYDESGQPVGIGIGALYDPSVGGRIQIEGSPFAGLVDVSSANLNSYLTSGWYFGTGVTNAPTSGAYAFEVLRYNATNVVQIAYARDTSAEYMRRLIASSWGAWSSTKAAVSRAFPASISSSGGSASLNAETGRVTFSGVTSLSLNTVFTTLADVYTGHLELSATSVATDIRARFRATTTDATTGIYTGIIAEQSSGSTVAGTYGTTETGISIARGNGSGGGSAVFTIHSPMLARNSRILSRAVDDVTNKTSAGRIQNTTLYNGITIYTSGATLTGELWIDQHPNA